MSESKEGARSPQRSERVPGGVRESKWAWLQYTGLYSLSSLPPSFSLVVFVGCPLWLVPKHLKAKSSTALLACHTNWNRKWLSAPGTITTLFSNDKKSPKNKKKITLKRITRTTRGWCLSDDCRDGCWLSARLAEGWHQYKGSIKQIALDMFNIHLWHLLSAKPTRWSSRTNMLVVGRRQQSLLMNWMLSNKENELQWASYIKISRT